MYILTQHNDQTRTRSLVSTANGGGLHYSCVYTLALTLVVCWFVFARSVRWTRAYEESPAFNVSSARLRAGRLCRVYIARIFASRRFLRLFARVVAMRKFRSVWLAILQMENCQGCSPPPLYIFLSPGQVPISWDLWNFDCYKLGNEDVTQIMTTYIFSFHRLFVKTSAIMLRLYFNTGIYLNKI